MSLSLRVASIAAVVFLGTATVRAGGPHRVLRCQTRVARAAEVVVRARQHALTVCLDAPAATCAAALTRADARGRRLDRAARGCADRPTDETLGPEGIGWESLAPVCPTVPLATIGDAIACLERALPCVADVAITDAVPEAIPWLAERGLTIDRRCLAPAVCGDDVREGEEECDDGNLEIGDGCDAACRVEVAPTCGNGVLDDGEECDDGSANSDVLPDHCRTSCQTPYCGDAIVDPDEGEECEPPATATCDDDCFVVDAGLLAAAAAAPARSCAGALAKAVARVTRTVQRQAGACALALARCSLVDEDPSERCLARAEQRCRTAARRRAVAAGRVADGLVTPCAETSGSIAVRLERAACVAEAAVSRSIPRADELMLTELVDLDGDDAFPCVVDLSELD